MFIAIFGCSCLFEFRDALLLYLWLDIFIRGIILESESLIIKLLNLQRFKYSLFNIIMINLFLFLCPLLIILFHIIQLLPFKLLSAVHKKLTNNGSIYPSLDNIYLSVKVLFFRRLINNYCIFFTVYLFISYENIRWAIEIISSVLTNLLQWLSSISCIILEWMFFRIFFLIFKNNFTLYFEDLSDERSDSISLAYSCVSTYLFHIIIKPDMWR